MAKDVIRGYLDRYADDEKRRYEGPRRRYVVVIPAFDETIADLPMTSRDDVLTIVVANAPDHLDRGDGRVERTAELARELAGHDNVFLIDRVEVPIPKRLGVGLARKIGCDTAARMIAAGTIEHPVIYSTDADVDLPNDYFEATDDVTRPSTWIYPFRHRAVEPAFELPIRLYDAHMRHYVHQLDEVDSPYAYHSLGSLIAVHVDAYAAVRGFPKRNAGEDFYLLNKLAKVAPIVRLTAPVIDIQARPSERVPFGTGPALQKIQSDSVAAAEYPSYDPRSFSLLDDLYQAARQRVVPAAGSDLGRVLDSLSYRVPLERLVTTNDPALRHFHTWFDGFRTMKLIRAARSIFPDQPLLATLKRLFPDAGDPWTALIEHDSTRGGRVGIPAR